MVGPAGEKPAELESAALVRRIGLCAAFALNVMLFALPAYFGMRANFEYAGLFRLLALILATFSVLVGGTYFFGRAIGAVRTGAVHMDLPIAIGIAGAYLATVCGWMLGRPRLFYPDFVATFILLMLVGRWAQVSAVERNRRLLLRHQGFRGRIRLGTGEEIARERLESGQLFVVGPGETVPVDARLEDPAAAFSMASINGEAESRLFRAGQVVQSGAVNLDRAGVRLCSMQPWSRSLLAQLLAPARRTGYRHQLTERIVRGYVVGIIGGGALTGLGWLLATGDAERAGAAAIAVLVVSCPCAIGLALPLADEMATVDVRSHGVFVRDNDLWSKLGRVRKLIFDKTGTLTLENPVLLNPQAVSRLGPGEREALIALVQGSHHPVGRCLHEALLSSGPGTALSGDVHEEIGSGVSIGPWSLGRAGWLCAGSAGPETVFSHSGRPVARFQFADATRPGAADDLARLTRRGYEVYILSGDRKEKVDAFADEIGVPRSCAVGGLAPGEKAAWIGRNAPGDAMMIGDGANDSLAFDLALCRGTPVVHRGVLEGKADFYYLRRGIEGIEALLEAGQRKRNAQRAVIVYSVAYNLAAAGFAAAGMVSPLVAAVLMPASSLASLAIVTIGMHRRR
jgi:Cu2+-exporting ATPase